MCDPVTAILLIVATDEVANDGKLRKGVTDFVVNDIIKPVAETIGEVVQAAASNPIKTIAQIAAVASGNAWALPLIEGADVAAHGGSIEDVLKATAKAYVAQEVGSYVGENTSAVVAKETGSKIAGEIIGSGTAAASVAIVTGQDPVKAFVSGGVNAGTSAVLGKVDQTTGGNFSKLPPTAQRVIQTAIAAQLTNNPNASAAVINSLIASSGVVTDAINSFDPTGTKLSNTQRAILTDVLMGTATAALSGGNVSAAYNAALMKNGAKALGDMATDAFKNASTGADTAYKSAETKASQLDTNEADQKSTAEKYNTVAAELQKKIDKQNELKSTYDKAIEAHNKNPSQATADAANAAVKAYNDYVTVLNKEYTDTYKPNLDKYGAELDKLKATHAVLANDYEAAIKAFATKTDTLSDTLKPLYEISNKAFVETLDPSFNAEEYKKLNGLGTDTSAYEHYLTKGQLEGLPTNNKAAESSFSAEKVRLIQELADKKGISLSQITDTDIKNFFGAVDTKYGGNLSSLKNASIQDFLTGNTKTYDDLLKESKADGFVVEVTGRAHGEWDKPTNYDVPAGMKLATQDEFANNKAVLDYTKDGQPVWVSVDKGVQEWDAKTGTYTYKTPEAAEVASKITSESLKNDDPQAWLIAASQIKYNGDNAATKFLYDYAEKVADYAKSTGNSTVMNAAGNALKAGGGILQSFNGLVTLAGINPNSTLAGKFADKLINLGKATTTAEYQAAIADMNKTMGSGNGIIGTGKAIWGAFTNHPTEFLAEIVGVEGMQELVPLLIGSGASTAAKGLALAKGMGTKLAAEWAAKAGISAAVASDIAESVGGSAAGAFDTAYNLARAKGMTEAQATQVALEIAGKTGLTSGVVTALSMKVGGAALEKAILGKAGNGELASAIDALGKKMAEGGKVTVKEGVTEGIEEGLTQAYLEGQLYQLDPTRDVAGNITSSTIIGAIAGGGVAGGSYAGANTGNTVANLLLTANPKVAETVNSSANAAAAVAALNTLGVTDAKLQANLLNNKYDAAYTSTDEATDALRARTDFQYTDADINALTGQGTDATLTSRVDTYVDPKVFDIGEVKAAAAAEGYTISDADAAKLIGQKDEATATTAARTQFDPLATTYEEAKQILTDSYKSLGFTVVPTTDQITKFVGSVAENTQKTAIGNYVGENTVTTAEAKKYLTDLGYKPTDAEVAKFVGAVNEKTQASKIAEYVDPLLVDKDEVKAAYTQAGLKEPTDEDITRFIGQYAESELATKIKDFLPVASANVISAAKTDILAKMADYESAGKSRDEALSLAIDDVATQLGTTREDILTKIGSPAVADDPKTKDINEAKPATGIYADLGNIKTDIQTKYDSLTQSQKDLADQLTKQGVDLNTAIDTVKSEVGNVKTTLGHDVTAATQSDLDAMIKMLEQNGAYDAQYDYNGDKVIDQKDKTAVETYIKSQQPGYTPDTDTPFTYNPAAGSKWAPTGVFATMAENKAATDKAIADEAEKTRQANAAAALKTQRMGNINQLVNMLGQAGDTGGQQVTVKAADPAKIGYIYDWSSIFANPSQANMFVSPYAKGGLVDGSDDVNEELLKILKG